MAKTKLECTVCLKLFSKKSNLKRHVAVKHNYDVELYSCGICFKDFKFRIYLMSHLKLHSNKIQCTKCDATFSKKCNLSRHMNLMHNSKDFFTCAQCNRQFKTIKLCSEHVKSHAGYIHKKICAICGHSAPKLKLIEHFQVVHGIEIMKQIYHFDDMNDFLDWKKYTEEAECSSYVKNTGDYSRSDGSSRRVYRCYREGFYRIRNQNNITLKILDSNKIGGFCPAQLDVVIKMSEVIVEYTMTHVGHSLEIDKLNKISEKRLEKNISSSATECPSTFDRKRKEVEQYTIATQTGEQHNQYHHFVENEVQNSTTVNEEQRGEQLNECHDFVEHQDNGMVIVDEPQSFQLSDGYNSIVASGEQITEQPNVCQDFGLNEKNDTIIVFGEQSLQLNQCQDYIENGYNSTVASRERITEQLNRCHDFIKNRDNGPIIIIDPGLQLNQSQDYRENGYNPIEFNREQIREQLNGCQDFGGNEKNDAIIIVEEQRLPLNECQDYVENEYSSLVVNGEQLNDCHNLVEHIDNDCVIEDEDPVTDHFNACLNGDTDATIEEKEQISNRRNSVQNKGNDSTIEEEEWQDSVEIGDKDSTIADENVEEQLYQHHNYVEKRNSNSTLEDEEQTEQINQCKNFVEHEGNDSTLEEDGWQGSFENEDIDLTTARKQHGEEQLYEHQDSVGNWDSDFTVDSDEQTVEQTNSGKDSFSNERRDSSLEDDEPQDSLENEDNDLIVQDKGQGGNGDSVFPVEEEQINESKASHENEDNDLTIEDEFQESVEYGENHLHLEECQGSDEIEDNDYIVENKESLEGEDSYKINFSVENGENDSTVEDGNHMGEPPNKIDIFKRKLELSNEFYALLKEAKNVSDLNILARYLKKAKAKANKNKTSLKKPA